MAYIGKIPLVGDFKVVDNISVVNNQAAYNMQVAGVNVIPETAQNLIVSLNGVIQKPGSSYTVSGSTITFSQNLVTGDVIDFIQILGSVLDIGTPSDATVTTSKLGSNAVTSAKMFSGFANGITMADQWRLTAELTGSQNVISNNLERVSHASQGTIGTGMTESSGIFSFPSTGTYLVIFNANFRRGYSDTIANVIIEATTNNSSYENIAGAYNNASAISGGYNNVETKALINVTDISNVKVRFEFSSATSGGNNHVLHGNTGINSTTFTFIRLGDST